MINKEEIKNDFNETFSELETTIKGFDDKKFNEIPFEESWTAAQVTQHIILATEGLVNVLNAKVATTDRPFDELKPRIKADFLNFVAKMKSPDFIFPELKEYDKEEILLKVEAIQLGIIKEINDLDLSKTCLNFEMPGYGNLTRLEAVYFVIYHTERHVHQLKEIHRFLKIT